MTKLKTNLFLVCFYIILGNIKQEMDFKSGNENNYFHAYHFTNRKIVKFYRYDFLLIA